MKKTIVVPIGFSAGSLAVAQYAVDFAIAVKGSITLLHVCNLPALSQQLVQAETMDAVMRNAEKNMLALKKTLDQQAKQAIEIRTEIREGNTVMELKHYCDQIKPVIVVVDRLNSTTDERTIYGSKVLSAMRNLGYPIMIAPEGARFAGINNIGLACDLHHTDMTMSNAIIQFLFDEFHPKLHVLHVTIEKHGMLTEEQVYVSTSLQVLLKDKHPILHFIQGENIASTLSNFSMRNNIDLLIIIPKQHDMFTAMLTKSQSKQVILNTHVPVLAVHE